MEIEKLYDVYEKWLEFDNTDRIDIVLATALSQKVKDEPLWLILVGPSGDAKSGQLNALMKYKPSKVLHNLNSKSLVNGYSDKEKKPDLAPKLDDRIVLIPDMAQLLTLPPSEKGIVWSQLRDLYDGLAGRVSGEGVDITYKGLFITLIAASTTKIDNQLLIHSDLGTRELIYRVQGTTDKNKVMDKCLNNVNSKKQMEEEMREVTKTFLEEIKIREIKIPKEDIQHLKDLALYVTQMRAMGDFDRTHDLRNKVTPEEPTRILKQLKRYYIFLMNLDKKYDREKALRILRHLARSSSYQNRIKVMDYLWEWYKRDRKSIYEISEALKLGRGTIKRECLILESLGLIECQRKEQLNDRILYRFTAIKNPSTIIGLDIPS